jgi:hydroxyethylthiazole kinase-like sugar kinase family protein
MKNSLRPESVAGLVAALRERRPRILRLGNSRSIAIPRVIRALGATIAPRISGDVGRAVAGVDVLLLQPVSMEAAVRRQMDEALAAARHRGVPAVIDLTNVSRRRRSLAAVGQMIAAAIWPVVSATADELLALTNPTGRNTDPVRLTAELLQSGGLAAIRGSRGLVTDGKRSVEIGTWHRWLETASEAGPLASASIAAFLGIAHLADFVTVTAAALTCVGEAVGRAAQNATHRSMESRVIKELAALSSDALAVMQ